VLQYIEAPSTQEPVATSVFLGGGITNCPDWQAGAIQLLRALRRPLAVYNPRRTYFPMDDSSAGKVQIEWEFVRLRRADIASFWFSTGSINPIVLFELGSALERNQKVVIGIDPLYVRMFDVEEQTRLRRPEVSIVYNIPAFVEKINAAL